MAIVIRVDVPGMTLQQYEGMSVSLLEQIRKQKGFLAHAGLPIPGGMQIVEMWESQEDFDVWLKNVILPASRTAGLAQPIIQVIPAQRAVLR